MAYTVSIPRLTKLPASQETIEFKEIFPDLQTLTPVNAKVQVTHKGNYLEVIGQADGIITLTCDRQLIHFGQAAAFVKPDKFGGVDAEAMVVLGEAAIAGEGDDSVGLTDDFEIVAFMGHLDFGIHRSEGL